MKNNRGIWTTCILVICLGASVSCPFSSSADSSISHDADLQFAFAEHWFDLKEYYRAIGEYERFICFFPQDARVETAMYKTGLSYFQGNRFKDAVIAFDRLLSAFPSGTFAVDANFAISDCFLKLKNPEGAIGHLNRLIEHTRDINCADKAYYLRGWIYLEMDRWEEADASFGMISEKNRKQYRLKELSKEMSDKKRLDTKNPKVAGILAIIPGAGHLYCGRYRDATVAFILNTAMIYSAYEAFDHDLNVLGGLVTFFEIGFYSGNIYSAINSAHKHNRNAGRRFLKYLKENSRVKIGVRSDMNQAPALAASYQLFF